MKKWGLSLLIVLIVMVCTGGTIHAATLPDKLGYVQDHAAMFSNTDKKQLKQQAQGSKLHFYILTIPTLDGQKPATYSKAVYKKWKLKSSDVLLVIAEQEHRIQIQFTNTVLADAMLDEEYVDTDAEALKVIADRYFIPYAKEGDYASGTSNLMQGIRSYSKNLPDIQAIAPSASKKNQSGSSSAASSSSSSAPKTSATDTPTNAVESSAAEESAHSYDPNSFGAMFGKIAAVVLLIGLIGLILFCMYWVGKRLYRMVKPRFVELPALQNRTMGLMTTAMRGLEQLRPFLDMTKGESGSLIRQADQQLSKVMVELNEQRPQLLKPWYWLFKRRALRQLLDETTNRLNRTEQEIQLHIGQVQKVAAAEKQALDQLQELEHTVTDLQQQLDRVQQQTGFPLDHLIEGMTTIRQWKEAAEASRYQEPLKAAELTGYATNKSTELRKDVQDLSLYYSQMGDFTHKAEQVRHQVDSVIQQHGLLPSLHANEAVRQATSQLPLLQQWLEIGDMQSARNVWTDMNTLLEQSVQRVQQQVEWKQHIEEQLPLLEGRLSNLKGTTISLEQEWQTIENRYRSYVWEEEKQQFARMVSGLQHGDNQIRHLKVLIRPERQAYEEASEVLNELKQLAEQSQYVMRGNRESFQRWQQEEQHVRTSFQHADELWNSMNDMLQSSGLIWRRRNQLWSQYNQIQELRASFQSLFNDGQLDLQLLTDQVASYDSMIRNLDQRLRDLLQQRNTLHSRANAMASDYKHALRGARSFINRRQRAAYENDYNLYWGRYSECMNEGRYESADEPLRRIRSLIDDLLSITHSGKEAQRRARIQAHNARLERNRHRVNHRPSSSAGFWSAPSSSGRREESSSGGSNWSSSRDSSGGSNWSDNSSSGGSSNDNTSGDSSGGSNW